MNEMVIDTKLALGVDGKPLPGSKWNTPWGVKFEIAFPGCCERHGVLSKGDRDTPLISINEGSHCHSFYSDRIIREWNCIGLPDAAFRKFDQLLSGTPGNFGKIEDPKIVGSSEITVPPTLYESFRDLEKLTRAAELKGDLAAAHVMAAQARIRMPKNLAYEAERAAIVEKRYILKSDLEKLGTGDRRCFEMKNLKPFEVTGASKLHLWCE